MTDNIDAIASKLLSLTDPAIQAAIEAARVEAYADLAHDVTALVFGSILVGFALLAWKRIDADYGDGLARPLIAGIAALFAAFFLLFGGAALLDPWLYVTMQHPELWIAKRALSL